jgi:hypothetical protein
MIGTNGESGGAVRPPRVWLAVMGIAQSLGSEPMVGWQWYLRLKARGEVTVLTSAAFDSPRFLPDEARRDMVFLPSGDKDPEVFATAFRRNLLGWWRETRRYLKVHAQPEDRLLITVPAAVWMLPLLGGLPIPRGNVFFGPMGADWTPRELRSRRWLDGRNLRTTASLMAWRSLAPWLPGKLALRSPVPGFEQAVGGRFVVLGTFPEVEPPPMKLVGRSHSQQAIGLLYDERPRKRFSASLAYAIDLARREAASVMVVDAPETRQESLSESAASADVDLTFIPRMSREGFQAWVGRDIAHFVSLSASEGIPSSLIEALLAGCRLHVHDVGGLHWLIKVGRARTRAEWCGSEIETFIWTADSLAEFESRTRSSFDLLLDRLLAPLT